MIYRIILLIVCICIVTTEAIACDEADILIATTPIPPQNPASMRKLLHDLPIIPKTAERVAIGDSLVQKWPPSMLERVMGGMTLNLGLGADKTQNVLWRLEKSEVSRLNPKHVLLLIGTNNLFGRQTPCAIYTGIRKIIESVELKWPGSRVDIITPLPRKGDYEDARVELKGLIKTLESDKINVIDVDEALSLDKGDYLPDGLHLTMQGYEALTQYMKAQ